jgi:hypothetical protein
MYSDYGTDPTRDVSFGGDPRKDYNLRQGEYDHSIGQGVGNKQVLIDVNASYMLRQNLFMDLRYIYRNRDSDDVDRDLITHFTSMSLRLNINRRDLSF